jgi:hypothetical protein
VFFYSQVEFVTGTTIGVNDILLKMCTTIPKWAISHSDTAQYVTSPKNWELLVILITMGQTQRARMPRATEVSSKAILVHFSKH